jgi:hypothetical protein
MKKTLVITTVLSLAALSSMAQGYINADNAGTTTSFTISNPSINGGVAVKIGTPATAAGFTGAGPGQVVFDLYGGAAGTSIANLLATTPIFAGFNNSGSAGPAQGTVAIGNPFTLPTTPGVFDGSVAVEFLLTESVTVLGVPYFAEATATLTPATAGSGNGAPALFGASGIGSLNLLAPIPEPSTIVLGGLGAAALLAFRRRK